MNKPVPDMNIDDLDRAFSTSLLPLAHADPRIEEDEASYEFMRWRGAESMLRDCGFAELRTGGTVLDEAATILFDTGLRGRSGSVLLSAEATLRPADLYFIGINPGGEDLGSYGQLPLIHESLAMSRMGCNAFDQDWSREDAGYAPGQAPMQRRFKHIAARLGKAYGEIAATNLTFTRSRSVGSHPGMAAELGHCLRVHARFLDVVRPTTIWLMGSTGEIGNAMRLGVAQEDWQPSGYHNWTIGRGKVDFCGREYRLCHTPHLSFWDPEKNPDALAHAFGDLLVR